MRPLTLACLCLFLAGCGAPSLLITPVANTTRLQEQTVVPGRGFESRKIAIIEVEGLLTNAKTAGPILGDRENRVSLFAQQLQRAADDSDVVAVVLRINSPGGTVTASDTMYQLLNRFREKTRKPVIASCQEVAASGAYYVACATDTIIAQPTSVVGSIGVIFNTFNVEGTMSIVGIKPEVIKSGRMKDMASPFKPITDDERAIMQNMVDQYHQRFVSVVRAARTLPDSSTIESTTDGRVFTGEQAKAVGLVDQLGLLEDAIDLARKKTSQPGAAVILYKRPFGYSGSIYADTSVPPAETTLNLPIPQTTLSLPHGFYYLWMP